MRINQHLSARRAKSPKAIKEGHNLIEVAADKELTPNIALRDPVEKRELKKEFTITWVEIKIQ